MAGRSSSDFIEVYYVPKNKRPCPDDPTGSEKDDEVAVDSAGETFMYVIPSFDILGLPLRHLKIRGFSRDGKEMFYDTFVRNCPSLDRLYPATMIIKDVTIIKESEFSVSVDITSLKIPPQGVFVIWEWLWVDDIDHVSETSSEDIRALSPSIESCNNSGTGDSNILGSPEPLPLHTITFKCIGCTRDLDNQKILEEVSRRLTAKEHVPVNLYPEPENKFDNKAIAFKCFIADGWHRIGYIVKEALEDVHSALNSDTITDIQFAWARYLVTWTRSGPGYFTGINIIRKGK